MLRLLLRRSRNLSSQRHVTNPIYTVWSSNTSVGKTLVSTGLAASSLLRRRSRPSSFLYLKPVQTGFPSDSSFVFSKLTSLALRRRRSPLLASHRVLNASAEASGMRELECFEEKWVSGDSGRPSRLVCKTMYAWREAISPHLSAERENAAVEDSALLEMVQRCFEFGVSGMEKRRRRRRIVSALLRQLAGSLVPGLLALFNVTCLGRFVCLQFLLEMGG